MEAARAAAAGWQENGGEEGERSSTMHRSISSLIEGLGSGQGGYDAGESPTAPAPAKWGSSLPVGRGEDGKEGRGEERGEEDILPSSSSSSSSSFSSSSYTSSSSLVMVDGDEDEGENEEDGVTAAAVGQREAKQGGNGQRKGKQKRRPRPPREGKANTTPRAGHGEEKREGEDDNEDEDGPDDVMDEVLRAFPRSHRRILSSSAAVRAATAATATPPPQGAAAVVATEAAVAATAAKAATAAAEGRAGAPTSVGSEAGWKGRKGGRARLRVWPLKKAEEETILESVWRLVREYFSEIAWDIVYVGNWLFTPFIGGLPPALPPALPPSPPKASVVIVPGFCGRPRPFAKMQARIAAMGHPCYVMDGGWNMGSIIDKGRELSALLEANDLHDVIVVGHSMGGLVAAEAMIRGDKRISRMIAVGVPFHGSYLALVGLLILVYVFAAMDNSAWAVLLLLLLLSVPASRQMLPNSDLIACLRPHYPSIASRVSCIYSPSDNILLVAASALLLQDEVSFAKAIECPVLGHAHLLYGDNAHDLIVSELLATPPPQEEWEDG